MAYFNVCVPNKRRRRRCTSFPGRRLGGCWRLWREPWRSGWRDTMLWRIASLARSTRFINLRSFSRVSGRRSLHRRGASSLLPCLPCLAAYFSSPFSVCLSTTWFVRGSKARRRAGAVRDVSVPGEIRRDVSAVRGVSVDPQGAVPAELQVISGPREDARARTNR